MGTQPFNNIDGQMAALEIRIGTNDDRQVGAVGNRAKILFRFLIAERKIGFKDRKGAVGAGVPIGNSLFDGVRSGCAGDIDDDRRYARHGVDGDVDDTLSLLPVQDAGSMLDRPNSGRCSQRRWQRLARGRR